MHAIHSIFYSLHVFDHRIHICEFLYVYRSLSTRKFSNTKFRPLEFFCVSLYIEFLSDLHEKFQVASVNDVNVECQIWRFCCNLFLNYADNRHTHLQIHTQIKRWKYYFWIYGTSKHVNPSKSPFQKCDPPPKYFYYHVWKREGKNSAYFKKSKKIKII